MTNTFDLLKATIITVTGGTESLITEQTHIATMAFDSLDEIEILMMLEESLEIEIVQTEFTDCKTLGDISVLLNNKISSKSLS